MSHDEVIGAIVLAGGRSRRMGRDKARVEVGGRTMVERVCDAIRDGLGTGVPIVVVAAPGQTLPRVDAAIVRDQTLHPGPLVGMATGLRHAAHHGWTVAYLAAVDHAALTGAHPRECLRLLRDTPQWAALPVVDGHDRPLAAMVRVEPALARAEAQIVANRRAARALFSGDAVLRFTPTDAAALRSHDEPSDVTSDVTSDAPSDG